MAGQHAEAPHRPALPAALLGGRWASGKDLPCAATSAPPAGRGTGQYSKSQNRQAGSAALVPRPQSAGEEGRHPVSEPPQTSDLDPKQPSSPWPGSLKYTVNRHSSSRPLALFPFPQGAAPLSSLLQPQINLHPQVLRTRSFVLVPQTLISNPSLQPYFPLLL